MKRKKNENNENFLCIVHYSNKDDSKHIGIRETPATNEEQIRLAKSEPGTYIDIYFHREQCTSIPNEI